MDRYEFRQAVKKIYKSVSDEFFDKIELYKVFLQEYNKKINLTNLDSEDKIYSLYFYESIVPYTNISFNIFNTILDIGSGSGIPGVVLKLLFPKIKLTIIEANSKKVNFLNELKKTLNIDFKVVNKRAEDIDDNEYEYFDLVTSRAVAPLNQIIEISLPYVRVGGLLVEPKGKNYMNEFINTENIVKKLGGHLIDVIPFVSINNIIHNVVEIQKIKPTDHKYPRDWKSILKGFK